jgi:ribosome-associated toxin RatA of RatAB toxin-antitoxin module
VEKIAGPVFNHIANTLVEVFVKRAVILYGAG